MSTLSIMLDKSSLLPMLVRFLRVATGFYGLKTIQNNEIHHLLLLVRSSPALDLVLLLAVVLPFWSSSSLALLDSVFDFFILS